jgi:hypothetical protein
MRSRQDIEGLATLRQAARQLSFTASTSPNSLCSDTLSRNGLLLRSAVLSYDIWLRAEPKQHMRLHGGDMGEVGLRKQQSEV